MRRNRQTAPVSVRLLPLLLGVFLLAASAQLSAMSLAGRQNRREFMKSVADAFWAGDYATLEATTAELRAKRDRFPDGTWTMPAFYDALDLHQVSHANAASYEEHLAKWKAAAPRSVTVRIVEANALPYDTWENNGQGLSGKAEWSTRVPALLAEAEHLEATTPPDWYNAMLRFALHQGWDRAEYDALFDRAVAAEPAYLSFYFNRAIYLFSYGEAGDWEKFALDAGRRNLSGEGMGIYSRIAWSLAENRADDYLAKYTQIQWPLMRNGFWELDKIWAGADWNLNNFCRFACLAGDRATARILFARIGDRWTTNWLSHKVFNEWAAWAGAEETPVVPALWRFVLKDDDQPLAWNVRFAPDGNSLFAGYDHARIVRWNLANGSILWRGNLEGDGSVDGIDVSPDGHWLAAGTGPRNRRPNLPGAMGIWDLHAPHSGREPDRRLAESRSGVHGVHFSPDGKTLAASCYNQVVDLVGELHVWSLADWTEVQHESNLAFPVFAMSYVSSGDAPKLAFTSVSGFNVVEAAALKHVIWQNGKMDGSAVRGIAVTPDSKTLACATADGFENRDRPGEVIFWNTADWTRRETPHVSTAGGVGSLAYSPDGRWLLGGGYDGVLRVWDAATGKVAASWPGEPGSGSVNSVAFGPDNKRVAVVHSNGVVMVYAFNQ